ncbi:20724_t:CDS:1, partial [Funneliformis geosporum]
DQDTFNINDQSFFVTENGGEGGIHGLQRIQWVCLDQDLRQNHEFGISANCETVLY